MQLMTPGGYLMGEVVSALQKCIRRGLSEEAMFWAMELEAKYPKYLWRRLMVIAQEDISIASMETVMFVETCRQHYWMQVAESKTPTWRLILGNAILAMCQAPKTRAGDDFSTVIFRRRAFENWKIDIIDCALDRHTARGKRMKRGVDHWRDEGCQLSNETLGLNPWADEAHRLRKEYGGDPPQQAPTNGKRKGAGPEADPEDQDAELPFET